MVAINLPFKIGDKVNVRVANKPSNSSYVSQVTDICQDDIIEISFPMHKNKTIYFINGERLKVVVGKKEAVYEVETVVIGKRYENIPVIRLKIISKPLKIQRRNYYRLKIVIPIHYRTIDSSKQKDSESKEYKEGVLLDISEGGIMFCTKEDIKENDLLEIVMDINKNKKMIFIGNIIRKQLNEEKTDLYEYGVKFNELSKHDRNALAKFIFTEQRKLLKKGIK
ncbi:MAG TPA: hypothetical protein GX498_01215 [Clostridiales bacterium]|nr:hypothetical protein [Clostridiales bacterium]